MCIRDRSELGPVPGTVITLTPAALYYDAARMTDTEATALAARIVNLVASLEALSSDDDLTNLSILTAAERAQVLYGWNQTAAPFENICVHQAFEAQVRRSPDALALVCDAATLTYAQLNARANKVAHALIGMGVRPGTLVGLCTCLLYTSRCV